MSSALGMFSHTLLGLSVCVVVCVCQKVNSHSDVELPAADQQEQITLKQTYAHVNKDNNKLGVFIAAAVGTITLMGVIYCIYNHFYSKHPYSHTQLYDTDVSVDMHVAASSVLGSCSGRVEGWVQRGLGTEGGSYGSLSDTPSIITLPPALSPPPLASPLAPPRPPHSAPLRTISAQDLQKSFL